MIKNNFKKSLLLALIFVGVFSPFFSDAAYSQIDRALLELKAQILRLQIDVLKSELSLISRATENCAQVEVSWSSAKGANSYRVYREDEVVYEGRTRSFTDFSLTPNKEYVYKIYGLYDGEEGEFSQSIQVTAPSKCPPVKPVISYTSQICGGNVDLSWRAVPDASVYQLMRGSIDIYNGPLTEFADSSLTPGRDYTYTIRAGNIGGWSEFSQITAKASGPCAPSQSDYSYIIPETSETGEEGELSAEMRFIPRNGLRIASGSSNKSVFSFTLFTKYSEIKVERVDLYFLGNYWNYLKDVSLRSGITTIAKENITRNSFTNMGEGVYRLRFENIGHLIDDDSSSLITVKVSIEEDISSDSSLTLFLQENSVRGVDGINLQQYAPSIGGIESEFLRTFTVRQ